MQGGKLVEEERATRCDELRNAGSRATKVTGIRHRACRRGSRCRFEAPSECLIRVQLLRIRAYVPVDKVAVAVNERNEGLPIEPLIDDFLHVGEVPAPELRDRKQTAHDGKPRIVLLCGNAQQRLAARPHVRPASSGEAEGLIVVVRNEVVSTRWVEIDREIGTATQIPVAVGKDILEGDEPEGLVDVE